MVKDDGKQQTKQDSNPVHSVSILLAPPPQPPLLSNLSSVHHRPNFQHLFEDSRSFETRWGKSKLSKRAKILFQEGRKFSSFKFECRRSRRVSVCLCVCMCVCVREREKEEKSERERKRVRERDIRIKNRSKIPEKSSKRNKKIF